MDESIESENSLDRSYQHSQTIGTDDNSAEVIIRTYQEREGVSRAAVHHRTLNIAKCRSKSLCRGEKFHTHNISE